ncbi:MAG: tRNA (N(6)-L-threonylcarbamoyladenosine(37)-C(2))-methylthiotransferase [Candidatus Bathyarchaeia archaeon]|jgi:MiaB-like tRNA modifying enzyme
MTQQTARVYVKSFGCSANLADGEVIAGCLADAGFTLVKDAKDAQVLVYNTCAVKSPTENRILEILHRVPPSKLLVVTGCLPLINFERLEREVAFDAVAGAAPGMLVVDLVRRVLAGEHVVCLDCGSSPGLVLPRVSVNPVVSIIPVNYGCLGRCAYCCVRFARGKLRSYTVDEVVQRVKHDLSLGFKEFWLTSQDTACYGKDIGTDLPALLQGVCAVDGKFRVRVGMMNPDHVLGLMDGLVEVFGSEKVFQFLHLPVQSGDDAVLGAMNRFYTVADFKRVVDFFRAKLPRVTVSTDVIVGFPSETKQAFENTKQLILDVKPDVVNISKFFARPNTEAAKLVPIPPTELNRRSREMTALCSQVWLEQNRSWVGWSGEVLFDERGKGESWVGRNFGYKPVVVKTSELLMGRFASVRVVEAFETYLEAELV